MSMEASEQARTEWAVCACRDGQHAKPWTWRDKRATARRHMGKQGGLHLLRRVVEGDVEGEPELVLSQ